MLSAKVPYFILDLLQQAPSVYVEGLGRFEAIFHPAVIDLPEARIKPPYVEPDFKYDLASPSEILPKYIAYAAGTTTGIANGAIVAFVRRIHEQTEDGNTYPIEKFGTFSRPSSGQIRFTPDWDAFNLSFSGLEVLDISPVRESKSAAPPYVTPPPAQPWSVTEASETTPMYEPVVEPKDTASEETLADTPVDKIEPQHPMIDQTTSRLWWIILTSAIVLIAILCAYLAWDIISNRHRLDELKRIYPDATAIIQNQDTVIEEDTARIPVQNIPVTEDPEPISEPAPPTPTPQEESGSWCYVVVGAFTDPANVTRMTDRLVSLGYEAEQLKGGTLTRVAIRTRCDADNLQNVLNDARSNINPEAWIY